MKISDTLQSAVFQTRYAPNRFVERTKLLKLINYFKINYLCSGYSIENMRKISNQELGRPSAEAFAAMEKCPVTVVLDDVRSGNNTGSFFRTGDAFAIERLCLCGITGTPPTGRSTRPRWEPKRP